MGARPVCLLVLRGGKGKEGEEEREGGKRERRGKGREGGKGGERDLASLEKNSWRRHWMKTMAIFDQVSPSSWTRYTTQDAYGHMEWKTNVNSYAIYRMVPFPMNDLH